MNGFLSITHPVFVAIGRWLRWYFGGFDSLLASLAMFVAMVCITNVMCAIVDHKLSGKIRVEDIFKNMQMFILVGAGNILDVNVIKDGSTMRTAVIFFYLSVEGMILLENTVHLGLPVPEELKQVLEQIRKDRIDNA